MIVLWSEFLALWLDRTRRRALPMLLATLLLLIPSLPARSACSCEMPGEGHLQMAHHHEGENSEGEDHDECEAHAAARGRGAVSSQVGHARPAASRAVTLSQNTVSRSMTTCCSCPNAPAPSAVAVTTASFNSHADNQTLVYAQVSVLSPFSFDALTGLFERAGPPDRGKPEHLFLASLAGRAPPVSL